MKYLWELVIRRIPVHTSASHGCVYSMEFGAGLTLGTSWPPSYSVTVWHCYDICSRPLVSSSRGYRLGPKDETVQHTIKQCSCHWLYEIATILFDARRSQCLGSQAFHREASFLDCRNQTHVSRLPPDDGPQLLSYRAQKSEDNHLWSSHCTPLCSEKVKQGQIPKKLRRHIIYS